MSKINSENLKIIFILFIIFLISRIFYYKFFNISFDSWTLEVYWQFFPKELMQSELIESIIHNHYQPPLLNLLVGFFMKFTENYILYLNLMYLIFGFGSFVFIYLICINFQFSKKLSFFLSVFLLILPTTIHLLKKIKDTDIEINHQGKKYFAPKTILNLKRILKKYPSSKILSGGTDLSLEVTKFRKDIKTIISLNSVSKLNFIKKNKNLIEIGATTSLFEFQDLIKKYFLDFYNVLKRYGSVQIRNVGTIAGNIATASPIGDTLPLLLSLDAKIIIQGINKKKILPLSQFFISYRKTKLKKGEFIYSIKIPLNKKNIFKAYKISKRFDDDISSVCASFSFFIKKNIITKASIAYGGMSEIPKRALAIEKDLINSEFSENTFSRAANLIDKDFSPLDDMRASRNYRLTVAKNLLLKAFHEIEDKKNIRIHS